LIDANRLLGARAIDSAIREHYGPEVLRTMRENLQGIATGDHVAQSAIDRGLRVLRSNVSRSTMAFSLSTAMMQPFGVLNTAVRIGTVPMLRGARHWAGDAVRLQSAMRIIGEK